MSPFGDGATGKDSVLSTSGGDGGKATGSDSVLSPSGGEVTTGSVIFALLQYSVISFLASLTITYIFDISKRLCRR